jgi:ribosome-dependent ATPase
MVPVSSLSGLAQVMGRALPMTYFVPISDVGTFTKGLGFHDLTPSLAELALFIPALTLLSLLFLRKRKR